ncbi:hypothetical protein GOTRE_181_00575 [Gordonia terrae NBRC 100016]|uniref:Uncharacterized protein n=1 Tax=Gordonia terrae NBRC 100016 TaxID=1089454 RepID=A0ABQ0HLL6_9ACTN|nr:hypothetical protein GOTRE_181_00575 [Gordonia terrae NBRC 100016]
MSSCSVVDCGRPVHARGWCARHYLHNWRTGRPTATTPTTEPWAALHGRRFGDLVAVSWDGVRRRWSCRCDCGRERLVRGSRLTSGHVRSCGFHHAASGRPGPGPRG